MSHEVIKVTEAEFTAFLEKLDEPPKENPRLKKLLQTETILENPNE